MLSSLVHKNRSLGHRRSKVAGWKGKISHEDTMLGRECHLLTILRFLKHTITTEG